MYNHDPHCDKSCLSLQLSIEPYSSGQNSLNSNLMKVSKYFILIDFNYNSLDDSKINQLIDLMRKKYHSIKKNYSPLPRFNTKKSLKKNSRKTQNS